MTNSMSVKIIYEDPSFIRILLSKGRRTRVLMKMHFAKAREDAPSSSQGEIWEEGKYQMSKHTNVETFKVIINISPPETAEIQQILQKSSKQQRYHLRFDFCNQTLNQVEN